MSAAQPTSYLRPADVAEALAMRRDHPHHVVIAGGTDIMVGAGERRPPAGLIDVFGCPGLVGIEWRGNSLWIAGATPYQHILSHAAVRDVFPMLAACVREIGAVQIQSRGTLAGNAATSSPVGDTLPCLLALNATIVLGSTGGERALPYGEFCTGYRTTALAPHELILGFSLPRPAAGTRQFWRKVGTRRAQSISKVMVAATAVVDSGEVTSARLAMGAVADRPIRVTAAEEALTGRPPTDQTAEAVAQAVRASLKPIDDVRSSRQYRLQTAANLARRFVLTLAE